MYTSPDVQAQEFVMQEQEAMELEALAHIGAAGRSLGAKDVDHLDGPAAAFNYIRIANLVEGYTKSGVHTPVLDWGCGYGQVSWLLQRRGIRVVSCDVESRPAREKIENLRQVSVELLQNPLRLPYDSGSFGAVLSVGVLEHVNDVETSLREINRVLRTGGMFFVFMFPNKFSWAEFIADARNTSVHPLKFTSRDTKRLLEDHGFVIEKRWRRNFLPRNLTGLSPKVKALYGKFYRQIESLDTILANSPPTSFLSGVLEAVATKRSEAR
jgi:SAM-dependent methyltransferase